MSSDFDLSFFHYGLFSFLFCKLESLCYLLPVDDLPHLIEILRPLVLIIEVVSMLPDVDVQQGTQLWTQIHNHILIHCFTIRQHSFLYIIAEPSPAWALYVCCVLVESVNELIHCVPLIYDSLVELTTWVRQGTILWWTQRVPEKFMVQMSSSIEVNQFWECDRFSQISTSCTFSLLLKKVIQICNICTVVLSIVKIHHFAAQDWLERSNLIGQGLQGNSPWVSCCPCYCWK